MLRLRTLIPLALTAIALSFDSAWSRGGSDVIDQALERAFPGCAIERVVCRLGDPERAKVNELADQKKFRKKTTFAYVARRKGEVWGGEIAQRLHRARLREHGQHGARRGQLHHQLPAGDNHFSGVIKVQDTTGTCGCKLADAMP